MKPVLATMLLAACGAPPSVSIDGGDPHARDDARAPVVADAGPALDAGPPLDDAGTAPDLDAGRADAGPAIERPIATCAVRFDACALGPRTLVSGADHVWGGVLGWANETLVVSYWRAASAEPSVLVALDDRSTELARIEHMIGSGPSVVWDRARGRGALVDAWQVQPIGADLRPTDAPYWIVPIDPVPPRSITSAGWTGDDFLAVTIGDWYVPPRTGVPAVGYAQVTLVEPSASWRNIGRAIELSHPVMGGRDGRAEWLLGPFGLYRVERDGSVELVDASFAPSGNLRGLVSHGDGVVAVAMRQTEPLTAYDWAPGRPLATVVLQSTEPLYTSAGLARLGDEIIVASDVLLGEHAHVTIAPLDVRAAEPIGAPRIGVDGEAYVLALIETAHGLALLTLENEGTLSSAYVRQLDCCVP